MEPCWQTVISHFQCSLKSSINVPENFVNVQQIN